VRLYRAGLRYLSNGKTVQRWLCRNCGYRFSESSVKINVSGKSCEIPDSGTDLLNARVFNSDFSREESFSDSSFSGREDVASHKLTVTGKGLNRFSSYNRNQQVCAQKDAKNLETALENKTIAGEEKQTTKGMVLQFALHCRN
jgi:hypothetical protein